jgi:hypothetical protein
LESEDWTGKSVASNFLERLSMCVNIVTSAVELLCGKVTEVTPVLLEFTT